MSSWSVASGRVVETRMGTRWERVSIWHGFGKSGFFDHEMCLRWGAGENEEVAISLGHRICSLPFDWSDEMGATRTGVRKMVHALGAKLVPLTALPLEEPLELLVVGFDDGLGMNTGPSVT